MLGLAMSSFAPNLKSVTPPMMKIGKAMPEAENVLVWGN